MNEDLQYHIRLSAGDRSRYAIICGDPGRVPQIAQKLENSRPAACNREFNTYSGMIENEKVLVTSTGIGAPSAAIAIEELHNIGVDTIIRVGTCGGISTDVRPGDLVVAQSAVRMEGTTKEYAPIELPACASFEVTLALVNACKAGKLSYKVGAVQSKDSFYGQHDPESSAVFSELSAKWEAWKMCGVLASEMECSALFVISSLRQIRAGAVLNTIWNQERAKAGFADSEHHDMSKAIDVAVNAMRSIIINDRNSE